MSESLHADELSAKEKAILADFEKADLTHMAPSSSEAADVQATSLQQESSPPFDPLGSEALLIIFVNEVDQDIAALHEALQQIFLPNQFHTVLPMLRRTAHKLKGTTAAMGCTAMATIASYIEALVAGSHLSSPDYLSSTHEPGKAVSDVDRTALALAVEALKKTLDGLIADGQEDTTAAVELEENLKLLGRDVLTISHTVQASSPTLQDTQRQAPTTDGRHDLLSGMIDTGLTSFSGEQVIAMEWDDALEAGPALARRSIRVDNLRLEQLLLHSEQLAGLHAQQENAQRHVDTALQELHAAQMRLTKLETSFSAHLTTLIPGHMRNDAVATDHFKSSLIARILHEPSNRTHTLWQRAAAAQSQRLKTDPSLIWDELEIEQFSESDIFAHSLSEAIADVLTASSQLRVAFVQLKRILHEYNEQGNHVRSAALLLRKAPLHALLPAFEQAIAGQMKFELQGGMTELDQDMLETLRSPLLRLLQSPLARLTGERQEEHKDQADILPRAWLHAREDGNEIILEVGFSQAVAGGALEELQETLRRLRGSLSVQRNATGGVDFILRLPRSQALMQGLLVRAGHAQVMAPFSQVERIEDSPPPGQALFSLGKLLGMPEALETPAQAAGSTRIRPLLLLRGDGDQASIQVDEIIGDAELVVKPLARHLQRPGILGAAIDGMNDVLLVVDLPALIERFQRQERAEMAPQAAPSATREGQRSVIIADDSVYIRQSLLHVLRHAGYAVAEAHDGIEALELLLDNPPDALLLDIEMPNLNGYDLLSIMRAYPTLAKVKVIMLTSRSLDKHLQRARELGVQNYVTKPCAPEKLLATLKEALQPTRLPG